MDGTELTQFSPTFSLPVLDKKYLVNNEVAKYEGYELPEGEKGDKTTTILLNFEKEDGCKFRIPVTFYPTFYPSGERINQQFDLVGGSRYKKQKKTRSSRKNKSRSSRKNKSRSSRKKKFLKLNANSK